MSISHLVKLKRVDSPYDENPRIGGVVSFSNFKKVYNNVSLVPTVRI
jgi:hypothetical protein